MIFMPLWQRLLVVAAIVGALVLAAPNLFYDRVERANDARAQIAAGITSPELEAEAALWPAWLPSGLVNLGLDLRGGAHLLAEVQVEDVYESRMDALWPEVRDALAAERETVGFVTREQIVPTELSVRISEPSGVPRAVEIVRGLARPVPTLTGGGAPDIEVTADGTLLTVRLSEAERAATDDRTVRQALEIIRRRIDEVGTREPTIVRQGADRILVQVPGVGSAQEVKDLIGTTAQLTFHPVIQRTTDPAADPGPGGMLVPALDEPGVFYALDRTPVVTGEQLVDAQPSFDQNGRPAVNFRFNPQGARAFGEYTAQNIGEPFAIVLDNEVISAPVIQSAIPGGSGIITGNFTVESSTDLAVLLRAGALPAGLTFLEERTVGPELGQDSIEAGRTAALIGLAVVVAYIIASYGLFGVMASAALAINITLLVAALSVIGATLTLPGLAGIVLTIGMAVDANVLVFERIREELRRGAGPARAIDLGYQKAMSAIVDANITTLITAGVLFFLGAGPVRGFAVTLGLGIVTSVFTALFVTRLMVSVWFNSRRPKTVVV
ncbi:protein translocase subunit SecD [Rubellimicrobium sp. CFH 75288]|uniref:protein translocase subunit SecD n=1 Tax=Rubellimicrobium sp. CFH 75288 TaxID=2697034 RepID=UPI00141234EF|nr:protein translocase subunit SecD [Rubellimicrobium sp. CFH 75288]